MWSYVLAGWFKVYSPSSFLSLWFRSFSVNGGVSFYLPVTLDCGNIVNRDYLIRLQAPIVSISSSLFLLLNFSGCILYFGTFGDVRVLLEQQCSPSTFGLKNFKCAIKAATSFIIVGYHIFKHTRTYSLEQLLEKSWHLLNTISSQFINGPKYRSKA